LDEKSWAFPNIRWGIIAFGGDVRTENEDTDIHMVVTKKSGVDPSAEPVFSGSWEELARMGLSYRILPAEAGRYSVLFSRPGFQNVELETDVHAGEIAEISEHVMLLEQGAIRPQMPAVTEPPVLVSPKEGAVFNEYPRSMVLKWSRVPKARRYGLEIQVCFSEECTDKSTGLFLLRTDIEGPAFTSGFVGAQWGRWRTWGIGEDGRPGPKSGWRRFLFTQ